MNRLETMALNTAETLGHAPTTAQATSEVANRVKAVLARALAAVTAGRAARAQRVVEGYLAFYDDKALLDLGYSAQDIRAMRKRNGR
jgi:hypothetical protein